jgi:hypothetical protein
VRGFLSKRRCSQILEEFLEKRIDEPAAIRLQRMRRGNIGRKIAARKKLELVSCIAIQNCVRKYVRRIWDNQVFFARLEKYSATLIQKIVRGNIGREIVQMKRHLLWYRFKFLVAVVNLQAAARGFHARRTVKLLRQRNDAAIVIQCCYESYLSCKSAKFIVRNLMKTKIFLQVSKIQRNVRRYLATLSHRKNILIHNGKVIKAARMIMRAWVNYKITRKYLLLLDIEKIRILKGKIGKYFKSRKNIFEEKKDIENDLIRANKVYNLSYISSLLNY